MPMSATPRPITPELLDRLFVGFRNEFSAGLKMAESQYKKIAMTVPSTTAENVYGWLDQAPGFREWLNERVIKQMKTQGYSIKNRTWEDTVSISRDAFEDDNLAVYRPMFQRLGEAAACFPDQLVFQALADGHKSACYDGQNFFDTEHPVTENVDGTGKKNLVSNLFTLMVGAAGATTAFTGPGWYLMDCSSQVVKPIVFQERRAPELTAQTNPNQGDTFKSNVFVYGASMRCATGYSFWQLAQMMRAPLNSDMFWEAWQAITGRVADGGRPLGLRPTTLVVPPSLEKSATQLLEREFTINDGGTTTNELKGKVELLVARWMPPETPAAA